MKADCVQTCASWVKDKSDAAICTPPPWPDPSSSHLHEHQSIQAQSNLKQQSKLTPVLWKRTFKKCIFAGVFWKQAPQIFQTFTFPSCSVGFCYTFVWSQTAATAFISALHWLYQPRLIRPLLFSHSLSFLLFIFSPFHSAGDKRFHSHWVCSKQDIHFCYSAICSLAMSPHLPSSTTFQSLSVSPTIAQSFFHFWIFLQSI